MRDITFGSVCSGIEAASVAWHPLGWKAAWLSEIEPFPCAVLAHHYPDVPNLGDMTKLVRKVLGGEIEAPDVFTGGTPCQAFSVAGKRQSLDDARGNLTLTFVEIADAIDHVRASRGSDPCVVVWENVPGVLSTKDNAFGCFLGALAGAGCELQPAGGRWTDAGCVYGPTRAVAWRVLDAQYFGLAQRRRRVFVVASARAGFDPAAVLFEREGVRRDSAPSREAREGTAANAARSVALRGREGGGTAELGDGCGMTLRASSGGGDKPHVMCMSSGQANAEIRTDGGATSLTCLHEAPIVAHSLRGEGFDASEDGTGRGTPLVAVDCHGVMPTMLNGANTPAGHMARSGHNKDAYIVPVAFDTTQITSAANYSNPKPGDPCHPLAAGAHPPAVAFSQNQRDEVRTMTVAGALAAEPGAKQQTYAMQGMAVRRLTPRECEALQGFEADYTRIPWRKRPAEDCPDGPRYKALGNSWAVPVVRWIGRRIDRRLQALAGQSVEVAA